MYDLMSDLTRPFTFAVVGIVLVSLFLRGRDGRRSRTLILLALLLLIVSHPITSWCLLEPLERRHHAPAPLPRDIRAIVVLSGNRRVSPAGTLELGDDTLLRTVHAAALYRQLRPPLLLTSGGPAGDLGPGLSIAGRMRDVLAETGVPPSHLVVEPASRTTYENAVYARRALEPLGVRRILLVTEALHMPRSVAVFRAQGFDVVPAPCGFLASRPPRLVDSIFPSPRAALQAHRALHEWMGLAWYWARGYVTR